MRKRQNAPSQRWKYRHIVVEEESPEVGPVLTALADPIRRKILCDLETHIGWTISYLMEGFTCSRQAVHKHLKVMIRAGIVTRLRSGREVIYYIDPRPIRRVFAELGRRYRRDLRPLQNPW